jgi:hypothetical protein
VAAVTAFTVSAVTAALRVTQEPQVLALLQPDTAAAVEAAAAQTLELRALVAMVLAATF